MYIVNSELNVKWSLFCKENTNNNQEKKNSAKCGRFNYKQTRDYYFEMLLLLLAAHMSELKYTLVQPSKAYYNTNAIK